MIRYGWLPAPFNCLAYVDDYRPQYFFIDLFVLSELKSAFPLIIIISLCGWLPAPVCTFLKKISNYDYLSTHLPLYPSTDFNSRMLIGVPSSLEKLSEFE